MKDNKQITLNEEEIGSAYAAALRVVSISRAVTCDETRQRMADALHEFYHALETKIESKRSSGVGDLAKVATGHGE